MLFRSLRGLWPPTTPTGQVVVTTRRKDAALRGDRRQWIDVGVFSADEARAHLSATLREQPHLLDGAGELARDLGYLPLALAQAGAYLLDRDLSCARYRVRLADRRRTLASLLPEGDELPDEHRATVDATWSLSVEQANMLPPKGFARPLLAVASMLDANGSPPDVFTAAPVLRLLATDDEQEARDGLACLRRLSLVTLSDTVRVHALVQRATRDSMPADRLADVARVAADALLQVWPEIDTARGPMLRANAAAVRAAGAPDGHPVLFRAGRSLGESGAVADAADYFDHLPIALSADDPDRLRARRDSAYWRGQATGHADAVTVFAALLADHRRVLGPDHPDTLATRHELARSRGEAGDPATAVTECAALLADQTRILGADHPDTLATRHDLARWRGDAGDVAGAVTASEALLVDLNRVLGADHPHTFNTRHNLAYWRAKAGDPAGAISDFEALLADRLRVLGADNPQTLVTRHDLARRRAESGDRAAAVAELETLLADQLRILGPDHPHTGVTRASLAAWRG